MAFLVHAAPHLASGLVVTVIVTAGAALVAALAATGAGLARGSRSLVLRLTASLYIEIFRGTAALVQLYWLYYALPLIGIVLPAYAVGIGGLGLCLGAYGAEVVRSAIAAVPSGQSDAASSLGLRSVQTSWLVVLPQAFRIMLPQVATLAIELLKASALVSLLTLHDLTFEAQLINQETLRTAGVFTVIIVTYYLLALAITRAFRSAERAFEVGVARE